MTHVEVVAAAITDARGRVLLARRTVGRDLAGLFGFGQGWGHIAADGSLANLEGLWYARNIKSLPLAMKEVKPELVEGLSDWQLLNMPVSRIMDLFSRCGDEEKDAVKAKIKGGTVIPGACLEMTESVVIK